MTFRRSVANFGAYTGWLITRYQQAGIAGDPLAPVYRALAQLLQDTNANADPEPARARLQAACAAAPIGPLLIFRAALLARVDGTGPTAVEVALQGLGVELSDAIQHTAATQIEAGQA